MTHDFESTFVLAFRCTWKCSPSCHSSSGHRFATAFIRHFICVHLRDLVQRSNNFSLHYPCTEIQRCPTNSTRWNRCNFETPYPRSVSSRIMAEDVRSSCWIKFIFCFFVETTFVATSRSPGRASTSTATLNTSGSLLQSLLSILRVETSTSFTFTSTVFKLRCWLIE